MENFWEDDSPHARFIRKLKRRKADEILQNRKFLQHLRFNWQELKHYAEAFAHVWAERDIDFMQYVFNHTFATPKLAEKKEKLKEIVPFQFEPLGCSENTKWAFWCPVQNAFRKHELFLPSDLFHLLAKFVPEPEEEVIEVPYDCEQENEWALPRVKVI